jgi:hypothetical protein
MPTEVDVRLGLNRRIFRATPAPIAMHHNIANHWALERPSSRFSILPWLTMAARSVSNV